MSNHIPMVKSSTSSDANSRSSSLSEDNSQTSETHPHRGGIIAVGAGKGGIGKTFLSILLAFSLTKRDQKVLLVDGDLELANVDVQLGITPKTDLAAVIAGWSSLEEAVTPIEGGTDHGGFDVLPGRSGSGALAELNSTEVRRLAAGVSALALEYDTVILDLGSGIDQNIMQLARSADRVITLSTDEPSSMTDAYAFMKVLRGYAPQVQQLVAINQAESDVAALRTYEAIARACQTFLGYKPSYLGNINWDDNARTSMRAQTPMAIAYPNAPAVHAVDLMAVRLLESDEDSPKALITERDEVAKLLDEDEETNGDAISEIVDSLVGTVLRNKKLKSH